MAYNVMEIIDIYLQGEPVRRIEWKDGCAVQFCSDYINSKDRHNGRRTVKNIGDWDDDIKYINPLKSLDKFGFHPDKSWEVL